MSAINNLPFSISCLFTSFFQLLSPNSRLLPVLHLITSVFPLLPTPVFGLRSSNFPLSLSYALSGLCSFCSFLHRALPYAISLCPFRAFFQLRTPNFQLLPSSVFPLRSSVFPLLPTSSKNISPSCNSFQKSPYRTQL